jgi:hypothetical protein
MKRTEKHELLVVNIDIPTVVMTVLGAISQEWRQVGAALPRSVLHACRNAGAIARKAIARLRRKSR